MAAKGNKSRCGNIDCIGTQGNGLHHIRSVSYGSAYNQGYVVSYSLVPKSLVYGGQSQFHRNTHIVPDGSGGCTCTASKSIDGDYICSATGNTAGNGGYIVDRCNLYNYRFLISSCFLQGYDKLSQVFDRVDIMVRGGGNGISSFRNHPCPGYISHDLCTWQMASDTRFCTLTHLYFNGGTTLKISSPYSEST